MRCPKCATDDTRVTDSRDTEAGIRRRRECLACRYRFTTYERIEATAVWVVKRDGRRERFSREKLAQGIQRACAKRPVPADAIERTVSEIEQDVQGQGRSEVTSGRIGELVMERLRALDEVAYVRFASVYRKFQDAASFRQELDRLLKAQDAPKAPAAQLALLPDPEQLASRPRRAPRKPRPERSGGPPPPNDGHADAAGPAATTEELVIQATSPGTG